MSKKKNQNVTYNEPNNGSDLNVDISQIDHFGIPDKKSRKQWYQTNNPQVRSYITGNLAASISGKGAKSLERASNEYQHLSEDLARRSYSSQAMSKKWDNFNGIDSSLLDRALENENNKLKTYQEQFNSGAINERRFNRLQKRQQSRINNLNENYNTLSEVWHNKHDIPLVRTQSSVSSLPFLLGTIGLPAAIIGGISGGVAAAPYIGKALANPWVQKGLTGLDVFDTAKSITNGNYVEAAANWIPYDKVGKLFKKAKREGIEYVKNLYNRYTAPRTSIKHTPYKGDQHQLTKFRLVNGGFDKLGINPSDVIYLPKSHPMYTPSNSIPIPVPKTMSASISDDILNDILNDMRESPANARKVLLKSEAIPLRTEIPTIAHYNPFKKMYTRPSIGKYGKLDLNTGVITAHEFQHFVDDVVETKNKNAITQAMEFVDNFSEAFVNPPGVDFTKIPSGISEYFRKNGGTELHARLAQLKNWYRITDPNQPITPEMWNYARRHYVPSMKGFDNNMQQMFRAVTDPKKFLDWINPRVAVQTGLVGTTGLSLLNNNQNNDNFRNN